MTARAHTYHVEYDADGRPLVHLDDLIAQSPARDALLRYVVAPFVYGAAGTGVVWLGTYLAARVDRAGWAARSVAAEALRVWGPIQFALAYIGIPALALAHKIVDARTEPDTEAPDVPDVPKPRVPVYNKEHPNPEWGQRTAMADAVREILAKHRGSSKQTMTQTAQPVQATIVEDWVPEFYAVTVRMYREPLTRARFDELWPGGQGLYYRYVGPRDGYGWEQGRWRHLRMIHEVDGRGRVEFCVSLDEMLHHTRRLWNYARRQGYSPTEDRLAA